MPPLIFKEIPYRIDRIDYELTQQLPKPKPRGVWPSSQFKIKFLQIVDTSGGHDWRMKSNWEQNYS